jgi:hypothetical protein
MDRVEHAAQNNVTSTTPTAPQSADPTLLSGEVAAAVGELKAKVGGSCQCSGNLARWLLATRSFRNGNGHLKHVT